MQQLNIRKKNIVFWLSKPVPVTFFISLLLSIVAALGAATIGRDAAFYLDVALTYEGAGWQAAYARFNWPWYSILLGGLHKITSLPLIPLAYAINALFLAGTCSLLVKLVQDHFPEAACWASLVVLAVPAFNDYRDDIWREYGFWFFCVLALYTTASWSARGGWWRILTIYAAIFLAALFRLEALFLVAAIGSWQAFSIRDRLSFHNAAQLVLIPVGIIAACISFLLVLLDEANLSRLIIYLKLLNPLGIFDSLGVLADGIAASMKAGYSRNQAGEIAFFGIIGAVLYEFVKSLGVFVIPFLARWSTPRPALLNPTLTVFGHAFVLYFLVLVVFFFQQHFTTGRYNSFLAMLAVPLTAIVCLDFAKRFPRLSKVMIALALISMLSNVVSLSPGRTHYREAADWIKLNIAADSQVYFMDRRIAFYAGREVEAHVPAETQAISTLIDSFDYFVLELPADHPELVLFLEDKQVSVEKVFTNKDGKTVTVFSRGRNN